MTEIPSTRRASSSAAAAPSPPAAAAPPPPPPPAPAGPALTRGQASPQLARLLASGPSPRQLEDAVDRSFTAARYRYMVDGQPVDAQPQFRMVGGKNQDNVAQGLAALREHVGNKPGQIPLDVVGRVLAGRGTTDEVGRVTQKLIDLGKLPQAKSGQTPEARVQQMMWEHGVGIDCAGYVQRALAAAHGKSAAQLGLRPALDEDLSMLAKNPHFTKVDVLSARPGDVITLRDNSPGQPGHTVLVARRFPSDGASMAWRFPLKDDAEVKAFVQSKSLEVFEVDASWGAGPSGTKGGVKRVMWIYNRETDQWASFNNRNFDLAIDSTPYLGHTLVGAFRPR